MGGWDIGGAELPDENRVRGRERRALGDDFLSDYAHEGVAAEVGWMDKGYDGGLRADVPRRMAVAIARGHTDGGDQIGYQCDCGPHPLRIVVEHAPRLEAD